MSTSPSPSVAIIGGGLSGAAVAYHLAEYRTGAKITVFEPRPTVGAGLAYGTTDPAHRINVPAAKMSLIPGQDEHFTNWISRTDAVADDAEALAEDGQIYVRRMLFGKYVYEHLKPRIVSGDITHIEEFVHTIERSGGRWRITAAEGRIFFADIVVLATTHPPPQPPRVIAEALKDDRRLIADSANASFEEIDRQARVTIIGSGLTMADVVASLDRKGHHGAVTAISRHGLLSRGHTRQPFQPFGEFVRDPPLSAVELLRKIRSTIEEAEALGVPWQAVIDAVRAQAGTFWPTMSLKERSRIVRHLRSYWDVHRFRVAPQVEHVINRRRAAGTFTLHAASISGAEPREDHILLHLYPRGSMRPLRHETDYVVITTGPAHNRVVEGEPHLASLAASGWIRGDSLALGILCNRQGRAIAQNGQAIATLLIAGPLARGTFGELMGLPQVTNYAKFIADEVQHELAGQRRSSEQRPEPTVKAQ